MAEKEDRYKMTKANDQKTQLPADFFSTVLTKELESMPAPISARKHTNALENIEITTDEARGKWANLKNE